MFFHHMLPFVSFLLQTLSSYSDHETGKIRDDASANKLMMIRDEMMNAIKRLG